MTRLENFLKMNGITPRHLASDSAVSLRHILQLRLGTTEPTRPIMVALATSAWRILRRYVDPSEMFDLSLPLFLVDVVTAEQGETFAREWIEKSLDIADVYDAFVDAGILEWPGDENEGMRDRYDAIEAEIIRRTFDAVSPAIAEAFTRIANEVLSRERNR